jgi:AcrR family transcriptional regulator
MEKSPLDPSAKTAPTAERRPARSARDRKADTQRRILDAAVAIFAARGYDRTSIAAIAKRAGVSRAAVFWHFSDKESLFQEAFRAMLVPFFDELKNGIARPEPRARLVELFDVYEEFVTTHRATIQSIVRWVFESPELRTRLQRPLLGLVEEFVRDVRAPLDDLLPGGDAAALAAALASALHGNLLLSLLDPHEDRRALRRAGIRMLADSVLAKGREPS